ncbi:hypothetical protein KJ766_01460, partial [Patescibacteria group bacterium]|nr:hypothetical protein [Patescibacteria group bacterium]
LGRQRLLGCDDSFLFSMLLRQIRVMATIKDACSRFGADGASISRDTGIHPYVVQKTIRQVSRMSQLEIKKAHDLCFFLDNKVKNGQISTKETLDIAVASSCALTF